MTESLARSGRCQCGGVAYELTGRLRDVINCHCLRCRRFTGHHMAATAVGADQLRLVTSETLSWYQPVTGVHYGFCSRCGSSLFWRSDATPPTISVTAGTLDQPTGLRTIAAWWVSEAADYHELQRGLIEYPFDG